MNSTIYMRIITYFNYFYRYLDIIEMQIRCFNYWATSWLISIQEN